MSSHTMASAGKCVARDNPGSNFPTKKDTNAASGSGNSIARPKRAIPGTGGGSGMLPDGVTPHLRAISWVSCLTGFQAMSLLGPACRCLPALRRPGTGGLAPHTPPVARKLAAVLVLGLMARAAGTGSKAPTMTSCDLALSSLASTLTRERPPFFADPRHCRSTLPKARQDSWRSSRGSTNAVALCGLVTQCNYPANRGPPVETRNALNRSAFFSGVRTRFTTGARPLQGETWSETPM